MKNSTVIVKRSWMTCLLLLLSGILFSQAVSSQSDSILLDRISSLEKQVAYTKPGDDHFMAAGLLTFGFVSNHHSNELGGVRTSDKSSSLGDADHFEFSPLFLWRHGKKVLLEFEPSFSNDAVGVNWADISYFAAPGLIIRGGYIVLPFGAYNKRLAAGWINKLASDPVGIPDATDYGLEMEGGFYTGSMKWSYDVAVSNGMQLQNDGSLKWPGIKDNNTNKNITARIGWLPFANSSFELGASVMTGKVGDPGSAYESVNANLYAVDMNLVENANPFQINVKGQYSVINVTDATYDNPLNSGTGYSFHNKTQAGYLMASLRPTFVENPLLKNLELAVRYGNYTSPANSIFGTKDNALSAGLDYWINWRTVLKFSYEAIKSDNTVPVLIGGTPGAIDRAHTMYLQFAIQL